MRLFRREASECKTGTSWYICNSPRFRGCCSVDACHQGGCPDQTTTEPVEPSITLTATPLSPTDVSFATTISTITASPLTSTSSSASIAPTVTSAVETSQARSLTSSITSTPSPTLPVILPIESVSGGSSSHKGAIVGGSVGGVVALALIVALLWFCCRKRKNGTAATSRFSESKGPSYREMNAEEVQRLSPQDIFAPFGGYQRSNSIHNRSVSNGSPGSQQTIIITRAPRPVSEVHEEDTPIRDMEKSSLSAPPLDDHPAMHPLPGQSPEVPTYHPGQEITSPELAQHPAYLAKHPSLVNKYTPRSSTTSMSSNLRSYPKTHLTFPFKILTSSTKRPSEGFEASNSLTTLPSQSRRNRMSRTFLRRSYTPLSTTQSSPVEQTISTLQDVQSPIPGRSELPAVVPQELSSTPICSPIDRLDMFKIAADRRMRCSPTGLGVKPPFKSNSPSQKQSTIIPAPLSSQTKPTTITETTQTPTTPYHPSPRSADSPALQSEFYIVSPDVPSGKFVAHGHTFDRKAHVSQMQIPASRSSPPLPLRHRASHPPDSPSPPQRPRIDTGTSSRGFKRRVIKHKESLGKGTENVMSWATYNNSTASSLLQTPAQKVDEEGGLQSLDIPLPLQLSQKRKVQVEELESPIVPPFFLHPGRGGELRVSNEEEIVGRWSGSTAAAEAAGVKGGEMLELPREMITHSPSVYSNDGEGNRYSKMSGVIPVLIDKGKGVEV